VELAVSVAETGLRPVRSTEAGTAHVTGLVAAAGAVVTAHARFTAPVKSLSGVARTTAVLPETAPALTLIAEAVSENVAGTMVTLPVPVPPV